MTKPPRRPRQLAVSKFLASTVVPEISCIVSAKTPLGFDLETFVAAAQRFIDEFLVPACALGAPLKARRKTQPGCWALVFVDTEREASDDGWHDLTTEGFPLAKVFLRVLKKETADTPSDARARAFQDDVTLTATHE